MRDSINKQPALFDDLEVPEKRERKKPQKLMHVCDAGAGEGDWEIVVMQCARCELLTDWFEVKSVSQGKRGIPCPRCNGLDFSTNDHGEYVVS